MNKLSNPPKAKRPRPKRTLGKIEKKLMDDANRLVEAAIKSRDVIHRWIETDAFGEMVNDDFKGYLELLSVMSLEITNAIDYTELVSYEWGRGR